MAGHHRSSFRKSDLNQDIQFAIDCGVLKSKDVYYSLTPGGLEMAQHMSEVIPKFFNAVLSPSTVTAVTVIVHVFLSIAKLVFGYVSRSAGLVADGIDNTVDTLSSVLVWLGIKHEKERLVSLFIIIMMFVILWT